MKIEKIEEEKIIFDNGNYLTYYHSQDCCEQVYADFQHIQVTTQLGKNSVNSNDLEFDEDLLQHIMYAKDVGFHIEDKNGVRLFVSCYNRQNGYYSSNLELQYIQNKNGREIITKVDISDCVKDEIY